MPLVFKFGRETRPSPERGGNLLALARSAGVPLGASCGGRGTCGVCSVFLERGDFEILGQPVTIEPGERREALACETVHKGGEAEVTVVRLASLDEDGARIEADILLPPHEERPIHCASDGGRILRRSIAVDIGTSTVAMALVDTISAEVLGRVARFNRQTLCGDDVASRILLAGTAEGLSKLRSLLVEHTLVPMIEELCAAHDASPGDVGAVAIAGNTVMIHLLLGLSPTGIGAWPFTPVARAFSGLTSEDVGLQVHPRAPVFVAPAIAGYVGGDIVADLAVASLGRGGGLELLIDIGTNGEMVLSDRDALSGCATAAGPAFEGAGLVHGCRAVCGAIERIDIAEDLSLTWKTIGGAPPVGICGSAVIDFIACARDVGLLNDLGRFELARLRRSGRYISFQHRDHASHACLLASARESGTGSDLVITEADIAQALKAKAAIYAGLQTLIRARGRHPRELDRLVLAGGFARHVRLDRAVALGLLPDIPLERIEVIGNGALSGAVLALLDTNSHAKMSGFMDRVAVVELNLDSAFADRFADALAIPHLDPAEFPSISYQENPR